MEKGSGNYQKYRQYGGNYQYRQYGGDYHGEADVLGLGLSSPACMRRLVAQRFYGELAGLAVLRDGQQLDPRTEGDHWHNDVGTEPTDATATVATGREPTAGGATTPRRTTCCFGAYAGEG